jgi:hypothetical protein
MHIHYGKNFQDTEMQKELSKNSFESSHPDIIILKIPLLLILITVNIY